MPKPTENRDVPGRDRMADDDFAGPDRSFPIKTQEDLDAAVRAIGRTKHDPATIRAGIERIARRKGLKLPDSWGKDGTNNVNGFGATPDATAEQSGTFETPAPKTKADETPAHVETPTDNVFPAGTAVRINHPTQPLLHDRAGMTTGEAGNEPGHYRVRVGGMVHSLPAHTIEPTGGPRQAAPAPAPVAPKPPVVSGGASEAHPATAAAFAASRRADAVGSAPLHGQASLLHRRAYSAAVTEGRHEDAQTHLAAAARHDTAARPAPEPGTAARPLELNATPMPDIRSGGDGDDEDEYEPTSVNPTHAAYAAHDFHRAEAVRLENTPGADPNKIAWHRQQAAAYLRKAEGRTDNAEPTPAPEGAVPPVSATQLNSPPAAKTVAPPTGAGLGKKPWTAPVPGNRDAKPLTPQGPKDISPQGPIMARPTAGGDTFGAGGRFDLTTPSAGNGEQAAALMQKGDYAGAAALHRSAAAYYLAQAASCDEMQAEATAGAVAGDRNGMTGNARRATVDYLIANSCGCWTEDDRPYLSSLTGNRLKQLEDAAQKAGEEAAVLNALKGEGLAVNGVVIQMAADGTIVGDYRAADGSRPALADLIRNYGTAEEREAWEAAVALTSGERQRLIDALTANFAPSRREAAAASFGKLPMPELREMVAGLAPARPVNNGVPGRPGQPQVRVVPAAQLPAPNYAAAGVGPGVAPVPGVTVNARPADPRDVPLALPRLRFDNPMERKQS